jgi:2-amino-4-hydroxy-6-hydroxymethyldihydropteridine diphosphokinase
MGNNPDVPRALIALGSNLGDRPQHLLAAVAALNAEPGVRVVDVSPLMEFAAVKVSEADPGGAYLNAAAVVRTTLSAPNLLDVLKRIERRLGRTGPMTHGAARVIDLDLILYDDAVIRTPTLSVPHPGLAAREFVLRPAGLIAGDWRVAGDGRTVGELLAALSAGRGGGA